MLIGELKQKIGEIEIQLVDTGIDIGPLIYISEAFDTDIDTAVKWIIIILICVFDPLAVLLVISFNITLLRDENDYEIYKKEEKNLTYDEDELNDRMDIIAQNGNTGEHYEEEPDVEDLPDVGDDNIEDDNESEQPNNPDRVAGEGWDRGRLG